MEILFSRILPMFRHIFNYYVVISMLFVGLFTILVDIPNLKKDGLRKEAKIGKIISILYIVLGPGIYILLKII